MFVWAKCNTRKFENCKRLCAPSSLKSLHDKSILWRSMPLAAFRVWIRVCDRCSCFNDLTFLSARRPWSVTSVRFSRRKASSLRLAFARLSNVSFPIWLLDKSRSWSEGRCGNVLMLLSVKRQDASPKDSRWERPSSGFSPIPVIGLAVRSIARNSLALDSNPECLTNSLRWRSRMPQFDNCNNCNDSIFPMCCTASSVKRFGV